jgi:hypothetical protein
MENVPQKSNRGLIIGVVVALLLCCCLVVAGVGGYYAYQTYLTAQQTLQDVQDFEIPTSIPMDPNDPNSPQIPVPDFTGETPSGGRADDTTRYTAWLALQLVAGMSNCPNPTAQGTTISVVQEPDANGEWKEEWNINCGDGTFQPYTVVFTPDASGVVNVNVEFAP